MKARLFFFEKKKQKTFAICRTPLRPRKPTIKSFLVLFFKKELLFFLCLSPTPASAQVLSVELQKPPRDFGYFIGDTMTAGAVIRVAPGTELDPQSLPTPGAIAAAIDVRRVSVSRAPGQVRVAIEYQTFVAPEEPMQIRVPGYTLAFRNGQAAYRADIPWWSFYGSPFRHERAAVTDPAVLRPDHAVAPRDLRALWLGLAASVAAAAICLFVLAGLRGWRPRVSLRRAPFASAVRQLKTADQKAAMIALHRAFDATAGRRVLADDVGPFLSAHGNFVPLRAEIERFFGASRAVFFGDGAAEPGDLLALARRLRRAERAA